MKLSFRTTQLLGYVIVVAVMGFFTIYAGYTFISDTVVTEALLRVQMDLNSAWSAYNEEKAVLQMAVSLASQHESLRNVPRNQNEIEKISKHLEDIRLQYNLDFLTLGYQTGIIFREATGSGSVGKIVRMDPVIKRAMEGEIASGTVILSPLDLKLKSEELTERAYIDLVQTERARPSEQVFEDRGMVLEAAIPIIREDDEIIGILYGGILLNRKYELVDKIRNAVFGDQIYQGRPLGTVTIFLWDVRVATNVIKADSTRAIGTRISDEVYKQVLEKGERFGDRAFVVNDWYLSAYDPIKDPDGNMVGILYVGLLEKKYLDFRSNLIINFLLIGFVSLLISVGLAFFFSGRLRKRIIKLVEATRELSRGNLTARVSPLSGSLEMVELASSFNLMAESLETRTNELEETSTALEHALSKADEKNKQYLEMLGFVTHELKSPLASIVFAIGALREKLLGEINPAQESTLKAASNSADYLNFTIANYLNLSRIEEGELKMKPSKIAIRRGVVDPVINRLIEMATDKKMTIKCSIPYEVEVECDPDLITSVYQNLISNAVKYGKEKGEIILGVEKEGNNYYKFSIYNEGPGFTDDEAKRMFTKFSRFSAEKYDTKSGTGLGLFVTKSIIEKHGGKIKAESRSGKWAKFSFTLPV